MEGVKIYEESHKEILRVLRSLNSSTFSVNVDKLDGETKQQLLNATKDVLTKRSREIEKVILGVQ